MNTTNIHTLVVSVAKWALPLCLLTLLPLSSRAQSELRFGYLSYDSVMLSMPEYAQMQEEIGQMRAAYEAEMKRVADDFNKKYEDFLDGQKDFPKTILQKRQSELQELLDKNIAFKKEGLQLLSDTEKMMTEAVRESITMAVSVIAEECGFAFVLNTDAQATPWLSTAWGEDITEAVKAALQE